MLERQPGTSPHPALRPDATPAGKAVALEKRRPHASIHLAVVETPMLGLQLLAAMLVTCM